MVLAGTPRFIVNQEFAHLHGQGDGSLHVSLNEAHRKEVMASGFGERHPLAAHVVMVFGARDAHEFELVKRIVEQSKADALAL